MRRMNWKMMVKVVGVDEPVFNNKYDMFSNDLEDHCACYSWKKT